MSEWGELGTDRQITMGGPGPVPGSLVRKWADREWPERVEWAIRVMRRIDRTWLEELEYRRKLDESARKQPKGVK